MAPSKALEILWIVLFRFRLWPRLWAIALIGVNIGALAFLDTVYGWMALLSALIGIVVMIIIYFKLGFVRLLGVGMLFGFRCLFGLQPICLTLAKHRGSTPGF